MTMSRTLAADARPGDGAGRIILAWALLLTAAFCLYAFSAYSLIGDFSPSFAGPYLLLGLMPRGAFALLAGAALGLSAALLQRVLRNPLADPSTLGIGAGAQLALGAATLFAPSLLTEARGLVAFAGGAGALSLVLLVSRARSYDPVTMILCGLVIALVCGALSATLILAGGDYMLSLYLWGGGTLAQSGWGNAAVLALVLCLAAPLVFALRRPLAILGLSDENARSLGASSSGIRLLAVLIALVLATIVSASAGLLGFVGLMAANLARMSGARSVNGLLLAAPVVGAVLLFATDAGVLAIEASLDVSVATGAVTALVGGPLLLYLLPRLPARGAARIPMPATRIAGVGPAFLVLFALIVLAGLAAVLLEPDARGLLFDPALIEALWPLRWPRLVAGAAAGAMLAVAGVILQRFTANPVASPEVLGISSGAGLGLAVLLSLAPLAGPPAMLGATSAGSLAALGAILLFSKAAKLGPERLLLGGIAVASLAGAGVTLVMAQGGLGASRLLDWMSGSTLRVPQGLALAEATLCLVLLPFALLAHRWLTILPLGSETARSLGVGPNRAGSLLVTLAAILTAASTLAVGPLSFVGLMAPHLARTLGFGHARHHVAASALLGALLMIVSDTAARSLAFPYQLPTGLLAALVGGPYLVFMLTRKAP